MRIVPLGGLGEIGRNMNVVEYNGHILLIDCGVLFPEERAAGRGSDPARLPLHQGPSGQGRGAGAHPRSRGPIGGVPYLLKLRPDIPLIGSKLTLAFVEAKCKEHRINR